MTYKQPPSYPPHGEWDLRMTQSQVCPNLQPVETIHMNDWFTIRNRGGYYTLENNLPQVVILPVVENGSIVMVRVKRPVIEDITLELPAGGMELEEDPSAGAARELTEETGIAIKDLSRFIPMPPLAVSPNRNPKLLYIFRIYLTKGEFEQRRLHDDEIESVESIEFSDVERKIANGEIYVTVPIAVISTYLFINKINNS